jgi:hypothetical protein
MSRSTLEWRSHPVARRAGRLLVVPLLALFIGIVGLTARPWLASAGTNGWTGTQIVPAAFPPDYDAALGNTISGVSCPAVGWCAAVASYIGLVGVTSRPEGMLEVENGTSWTAETAPMPPGLTLTNSEYVPQSVSCPEVGWCIALGWFGNLTTRLWISEILSDGRWTAQVVPGLWGTGPDSVTCPAVDLCYTDESDPAPGFPIDMLSDGTWTSLNGDGWGPISCPSTSWCLTSTTLPASPDQAASAIITGTTVSYASVGALLSSNYFNTNATQATACTAPGECVATLSPGFSLASPDPVVLDTLSGGIWSQTSIPIPAASEFASVSSMACPLGAGLDDCIGVGFTASPEWWTTTPVALTDTSGSWTYAPIPLPTSSRELVHAAAQQVACPTLGACVVGGTMIEAPNKSLVYNASYGWFASQSGSGWQAQVAPLPFDAKAIQTHMQFSPFTCPAVAACEDAILYSSTSGQNGSALEIDPALPLSSTAVSASAGGWVPLGTTLTYTATVTAAGTTPTGSVTFSAGPVQLCTVPLVDGTAQCSSANAPQGAPTVAASYSGSASLEASTATTTIAVGPPVSEAVALTADVGLPYSEPLPVAGGESPMSFKLESGKLPAGITLSPGGQLNGTALKNVVTTVAVLATDAEDDSANLTLTLRVGKDPVIRSATLHAGVKNRSYLAHIGSGYGAAPLTFALSSGQLPPGLSVNPTGYIVGLPTTAGNYLFGVSATDAAGATVTASLALTIVS